MAALEEYFLIMLSFALVPLFLKPVINWEEIVDGNGLQI